MTLLTSSLRTLPLAIQIALFLILLAALTVVFTRVYTTVRYHIALSKHLSSASNLSKSHPLDPPQIPYNIPGLGNALSFLAPKPGLFWDTLFKFHPREVGSCTLLLGGQVTHILFNPHAIQALFKSRGTSRDQFNIQLTRTSFAVPEEDQTKYYGRDKKGRKLFHNDDQDPQHVQEKINADTLLRTEAVNELTTEFTKSFRAQLDTQEDVEEIGLYEWLQVQMFKASSRALLGEKVFEYYADFGTEFWAFDRIMLGLFFGIPEAFLRESVKIRDRSLAGLVRWHEEIEKAGHSIPIDPVSGPAWEPWYGSRANRWRQKMYHDMGLSTRGKASFDLGFTFGLASNAIPATGWLLMHILDPTADKALFPRVMNELETARKADGSIDIPTLMALPLLQSMWSEVLRLYTDVLVTRQLHEDLTLPVDDGKRHILLKKGQVAIAPAWVAQHDPTAWSEPSYSTFYPERFLTTNPETGQDTFTLSGTAGKFLPFGGGKSICPGRVFAKQEVLAATAMVLINLELEVQGFIGENGKPRNSFPGLRDGFGGSGLGTYEYNMQREFLNAR